MVKLDVKLLFSARHYLAEAISEELENNAQRLQLQSQKTSHANIKSRQQMTAITRGLNTY